MGIITTTIIQEGITQDIGSFAVYEEYAVAGYGKSLAEGTKTSILVLSTEQERFREQEPSNILYLAEQAIEKDLQEVYNNPFATVVSQVQLLPDITTVSGIFIHAVARAGEVELINSKTYPINQTISWKDNLEQTCEQIYYDLQKQMSLQVRNIEDFGVDFTSFNTL